jgi:hypothetical protein
MAQKIIGILILLFVTANALLADDQKGTFQSINEERQSVTVRIGGKDKTYSISENIRFYDASNREIKGGIKEAKRFFKEGQDVILTLDGKSLATGLKAGK